RVLKDDPDLAGCEDIAVTVRGTVACLWGKVPSAVQKQRAIYLAGRVPGIAAVEGDDLLLPDGDMGDLPSPFRQGLPPRDTLAGHHKDGRTTQVPKKLDIPAPDPDQAPLY